LPTTATNAPPHPSVPNYI